MCYNKLIESYLSSIQVAKNYLQNYAYDKDNIVNKEHEVRCKRCHRVLKNKDAKLLGYGKTCYLKHLKEINNKSKKRLF